ncbi:MAG: hypothetical protein MR966_11640 [Lachnospiraceae bacterium]|nr:hypothetical protein [Lachnospiraceae bacterium]
MSDPKINIIKTNSFKEAYDTAPDELKDQIEEWATDYYAEKFGKLIASFNLEDTAFIVNALRCTLAAIECHSPEEYQLACHMMPEDMLQVMKYAVQEDRKV